MHKKSRTASAIILISITLWDILTQANIFFGAWSVTGQPFAASLQDDSEYVQPESATMTEEEKGFRICGLRIKEMLYQICRARSAASARVRSRTEISELPTVDENFLPRRPSRSVVEECCHNACTTRKLARYCGQLQFPSLMLEEPRIVSFQTFLQKLIEFFKQKESTASRRDAIQPWDENADFEEIPIKEPMETKAQPLSSSKAHLKIYSDETLQDFEDFHKFTDQVRPVIHLIKTGYGKSSGGGGQRSFLSPMQEIRDEVERPQEAVVLSEQIQ